MLLTSLGEFSMFELFRRKDFLFEFHPLVKPTEKDLTFLDLTVIMGPPDFNRNNVALLTNSAIEMIPPLSLADTCPNKQEAISKNRVKCYRC
jgi:hypothetical protein